MLKGIDKLLTGDLLKILCDMGHGDELVIADANFPAETCAQRLIRLPGIDGVRAAEAILSVFRRRSALISADMGSVVFGRRRSFGMKYAANICCTGAAW